MWTSLVAAAAAATTAVFSRPASCQCFLGLLCLHLLKTPFLDAFGTFDLSLLCLHPHESPFSSLSFGVCLCFASVAFPPEPSSLGLVGGGLIPWLMPRSKLLAMGSLLATCELGYGRFKPHDSAVELLGVSVVVGVHLVADAIVDSKPLPALILEFCGFQSLDLLIPFGYSASELCNGMRIVSSPLL